MGVWSVRRGLPVVPPPADRAIDGEDRDDHERDKPPGHCAFPTESRAELYPLFDASASSATVMSAQTEPHGQEQQPDAGSE